MKCERCEELEEEVRHLREQLYAQETLSQKIPDEIMVLTRKQREIFKLLLRWPVVSKDVILSAMEKSKYGWERSDSLDEHTTAVQICKMRQRLRAVGISIETVWGVGYKLNEDHRRMLLNRGKVE